MTAQERTDDAYVQIGEAAERTGLTQRTLRFYEEKGLLNRPGRMDGGFRLYSNDDIERLMRIRELKELLGFSLADIKEMLEAEDVRLQIKSEWRRDADAAEKAARIRVARGVTIAQLALIDEKMRKMAAMRDELAARLAKYDGQLLQWSGETPDSTTTESRAKR
jgi:DNA-binding transcriptional MerR regulator